MNHSELIVKYPPSEPCGCEICRNFCRRPGWWSTEQAETAIKNGLAERMMLEISPELDFCVLSPAFRGNESGVANALFAKNGCGFQKKDGKCALHGTLYLPIECAFCHHDRKGLGLLCHADLEVNWHGAEGVRLVRRWCNIVDSRQGLEILKYIHPSGLQSGRIAKKT